jgi:uncharacterized protein
VTNTGRSRGWRWTWRIGRIVLLVYIGVALVLAALQRSMIFPGAASKGRADAIVRSGPGRELVELRAATGEKVIALFGGALDEGGAPRADANSRPTLLFFYGNGMCLADCFSEFNHFRRLGFNVMFPEFVGYGMSEGEAGEPGVYATAEAAYQHLLKRPDIDPTKIVPSGWSLGAAAAIDLASKHKTCGLVTFSAFTSMADMARHVMPLPGAAALLRHHFESERKIHTIKCPVLIVHGTRDSLIPFDMSERLTKAAPNAKHLPIADGEHNTLFEDGGEALLREVKEFVERVPK